MKRSKLILPLAFLSLVLILISGFTLLGCGEIPATPFGEPENYCAGVGGVCFVAPRNPIEKEDMAPMTQINAGWVAVIPYAFSRPDNASVTYNYNGQWWGESPVGAAKQIEYAKSLGMKVMLKPHLWVWGQGWPGDFTLETDQEWEHWENDYADYILYFAKMADSLGVEILCIGTEIRHSVRDRPQFWKKLAADVRKVYSGQITYAANWDNFTNVTFWSDLDFIGIDAYFPLAPDATPQVNLLVQKWGPIARSLGDYSKRQGKKILFTEYGWMSVDGAAWQNWELEANMATINVNMQAQKNAYEAFFLTLWNQEWFAGGFLWKWWSNHDQIGGPEDKRYTPQNKPAADLISQWYLKSLQ
ncbi:MAG: hypothetical protein H6581_24125 [Bacteroidia bacterium]|nr:hypothetical protein [Bacteroidia bacterium]